MKIRLRLSIRMLLFIISAAAIVFFTTLRIIRQNFKKVVLTETMKSNDSQAKKYASIIKTTLENDFDKVRAYKHIIEENFALSTNEYRPLFDEVLKNMLINNPNYTSVWDSWELRFTDADWDLPHGRVARSYYRDNNNNIKLAIDSLDLEDDNYESIYFMYKLVPEEAITDPYYFSYTGLKTDEILETSLFVPLNVNSKFAGLVGMDMKLDLFQKLIDSVNAEHPFDIMLFSFNGDIIAHPNKALIGKNIVVVDTFLSRRFNILDHIQSGTASNYLLKDKFGNDSSYFTLSSFTIGNTNTPWAILITAPVTEIKTLVDNIYGVLNNSIIVGLIVLALVVFIFALNIVFPIFRTRNILNKLAIGDVHNINKLPIKSNDELGEMAQSINTVTEGLNKVTEFAENIGSGNFDYDFKQLSDNDVLGSAIIEMRNSLKTARKEEDLRLEEERQLEWASQGMNIFNTILRVDNRTLEYLTYDIIKTLTTYLSAHMGGIYVKTDANEKEFELISFIGFNKNKYQKKFITHNDGLTGQCLLEKETIFINDVPTDYDIIGSGLGKSIPRSILIVPLISNQILIGLIEIESINDIHKHQISFVERIAETIAATVATVKTNVRTAKLLDMAQKQAEELEQQEEEMRQNMEEMQATQEEASKRETELDSLIGAFNQIMPVIEYDTKGKIIDINDNYLKIHKTQKGKIIGKQHKADLFMNEAEQAKQKEFWSNLSDGQVQESMEYVKSGKDDYWFIEKFIPIKDEYGLVQKILCVGIDITEEQKTESKIKQIKGGITQTKGSSDNNDSSSMSIDLNHELKVIDLTYLKMVYKKNPSKIYNILKLYYDTLPTQVIEIEELAKKRNYKKLKPRINSLKTKMSYLGLKQVYNQLRAIEKLLSEQKNMADIPDMVKNVFNYWGIAYDELKDLLKITVHK